MFKTSFNLNKEYSIDNLRENLFINSISYTELINNGNFIEIQFNVFENYLKFLKDMQLFSMNIDCKNSHMVSNIKLINKVLEGISKILEKEFIYQESKVFMDQKYFYIHNNDNFYFVSKKKMGEVLGNTTTKRVILVRKDILSNTFESQEGKMGAGKLAGQVGHAIEGEMLKKLRNNTDYKSFKAPEHDYELSTNVIKDTAFTDYTEGIFTKIILTVKNESQFLKAYSELKLNHIDCTLITDVGTTVFNGQQTNTTIGIEPEYSYIIDCFTKRFQLLK